MKSKKAKSWDVPKQPRKKYKRMLVTVTEEEVKTYVKLKERHLAMSKKIEVLKDKFNSYAESVGFAEDKKVIIERGDYSVLVTETSSIKVNAEALNNIQEVRKYRKFKDCIETVTVINSEILMEDIEKALVTGKITKEEVDELITTTYGTRVTM